MKYVLIALFALCLQWALYAQDADYDTLLKEYRDKYPGMAFADSDMVLYSPANWQVFQRRSKYEGEIFFSGKVSAPCDKVSWRITGKGLDGKGFSGSFKPLKVNSVTGAFDEYVRVRAGGWYRIEIRAEKGRETVAEKVIEHVGVGEVFVGAGQSNSTNWGQERRAHRSDPGYGSLHRRNKLAALRRPHDRSARQYSRRQLLSGSR